MKVPYSSPINSSMFLYISLSSLGLGLLLMASYFIHQMKRQSTVNGTKSSNNSSSGASTNGSGSLSIEIGLGLFSSLFSLGGG